MTDQLKNILTELRQKLEIHYGKRLVTLVLYGSQARGEARDDSDIDVMVVLSGPVESGQELEDSSKIFSDVSLNHDVFIEPWFAHESDYGRATWGFYERVRREGIRV